MVARLHRASPVLGVVLGVGVLLVIAAAVVAAPAGATPATPAARPTPTAATTPFTAPSGVTLADGPPPWPLPADAEPYIAAAGLSVLSEEQLEVHYHAHLDVIADGRKVTVPAGIGFVVDGGKVKGITVLHTHDTSGIVHIESASNEAFTLGQVFTEWGVGIDATHVGGLQADDSHVLQTYVNGRRFTGDPATIRLKRHLEIALWYGPKGEKVTVPKSYRFPNGL